MRESFFRLFKALENVWFNSDWTALVQSLEFARACGSQIFFIGNGGSSAIASHMAADWCKNGDFNTRQLNDPAMLTCITNDISYNYSYELQLRRAGQLGDFLFAISSSGESENIVFAAEAAAKHMKMNVVTLTGFSPGNRLRKIGGYNFYIDSKEYGTVEIAHLAILHSLLDEIMAHDRDTNYRNPIIPAQFAGRMARDDSRPG